MQNAPDRFFAYPSSMAERVGFIIADVFIVGLVVVFAITIFPTITR
jgi:hypothetical protein